MPRILPGIALGAGLCTALVGGCLVRPVVPTDPATKVNFTTSIPPQPSGKIDLLFDIDNSASMGDKQEYLAQAIPDLITRLVTPNCVDDADPTKITGHLQADGTCAVAGSSVEFPPVHDMHIGIVSSALGPRLGDQCMPSKVTVGGVGGVTIDAHEDDQAHLLNRSSTLTDATETPLAVAQPDDFLNWFPAPSGEGDVASPGATAITTTKDLQTDFAGLVVGVHQFGCGIESQLESWYRFLVQPDPYASLALQPSSKDAEGIASWVGIDTTILAQRAAFLRPDSLVAIIVLSDENDSEVDVRSLGGIGYKFMKGSFDPPRATSACAKNPLDPACRSCSAGASSDPECAKGPYSSPNDWGFEMNLRHVHEEQKYGVSAQFPIQRYVLGLTSKTVPDRDGEYPPTSDGKGYASSYQGLADANRLCTNPLFAAQLPAPPPGTDVKAWQPDPMTALCKLPPGQRSPKLVYYAHIGGVPHQLLQVNPRLTDPGSQAQKEALDADDWRLILGNDPLKFDFTGIDPHMVESFTPRTGEPLPQTGFAVTTTVGGDPVATNEWVTDSTNPPGPQTIDLQYACTFELPTARDCGAAAVAADGSIKQSCDCLPPAGDAAAYPKNVLPPVCDQQNQTHQVRAKAYPTTRELLVAKLVGDVAGANPGIVSSLCPIHTVDNTTKDDPLYGYRPAVSTIVAALKTNLAGTCLPEKLDIDMTADPPQVPCLVAGTFPGTSAGDDCTQFAGYGPIPSSILRSIQASQHDAFLAGDGAGDDPSLELTCELTQLPPNVPCDQPASGAGDAGAGVGAAGGEGWCYVEGAKNCAQAIKFTPNALAHHVVTSLQCLEAPIVQN